MAAQVVRALLRRLASPDAFTQKLPSNRTPPTISIELHYCPASSDSIGEPPL